MVSKNNVQVKDRYATKQVPHYGIRKLSVGVASVLLGTTFYMGMNGNVVHADTVNGQDSETPDSQVMNNNSNGSSDSASANGANTANAALGNKHAVVSAAEDVVKNEINAKPQVTEIKNDSQLQSDANAAKSDVDANVQSDVANAKSDVDTNANAQIQNDQNHANATQTMRVMRVASQTGNISPNAVSANLTESTDDTVMQQAIQQTSALRDDRSTDYPGYIKGQAQSVTLKDGSSLSVNSDVINSDTDQSAILTFKSASFKPGDTYTILIPCVMMDSESDVAHLQPSFGTTTVDELQLNDGKYYWKIVDRFVNSGTVSQAIKLSRTSSRFYDEDLLKNYFSNADFWRPYDLIHGTINLIKGTDRGSLDFKYQLGGFSEYDQPHYDLANGDLKYPLVNGQAYDFNVYLNTDSIIEDGRSDGFGLGKDVLKNVSFSIGNDHDYLKLNNSVANIYNDHHQLIGTMSVKADHGKLIFSDLKLNDTVPVIGSLVMSPHGYVNLFRITFNATINVPKQLFNGQTFRFSSDVDDFSFTFNNSKVGVVQPGDPSAIIKVLPDLNSLSTGDLISYRQNHTYADLGSGYYNDDNDRYVSRGTITHSEITNRHSGVDVSPMHLSVNGLSLSNLKYHLTIPDGLNVYSVSFTDIDHIDNAVLYLRDGKAINLSHADLVNYNKFELFYSGFKRLGRRRVLDSESSIASIDINYHDVDSSVNIGVYDFYTGDVSQRIGPTYASGKPVQVGDLLKFTATLSSTDPHVKIDSAPIVLTDVLITDPNNDTLGVDHAIISLQSSKSAGVVDAGSMHYIDGDSGSGFPHLKHSVAYLQVPDNASLTDIKKIVFKVGVNDEDADLTPKSISLVKVANGVTFIKVDLSNYNDIRTGFVISVPYSNIGDLQTSSRPASMLVVSDNFDQNFKGVEHFSSDADSRTDAAVKALINQENIDVNKTDYQGSIGRFTGFWDILTSDGMTSATMTKGNVNSGPSLDSKQNDHAAQADHFDLYGSTINATDQSIPGAVQIINVPDTSDGHSQFNPQLTGPIHVIDANTGKSLDDIAHVTYSESPTILRSDSLMSAANEIRLTAGQVTDWSKIKSIAIRMDVPKRTSARAVLSMKDPQIYDHVGKTVYVANAIFSTQADSPASEYHLKPVVINAGDPASAKLTVAGQSTVKTMVHYTDAQGDHYVELPDKAQTYTELQDVMKRSDFLQSDADLTTADRALLPAGMVLDYAHPTIKNSNEIYLNNYQNGTAAFGKQVKYDFDQDQVIFEGAMPTQVSDTKTVTETIHYVYANGPKAGQKAVDDVTKSAEFSRAGFKNPFTGDIQWMKATDSKTFDAVKSPEIKGYQVVQSEIGSQTVTQDSDNIEKTVKYMAQQQKMTINYIDDDAAGKVLHTDVKTGLSNETADYTTANELSTLTGQHYVLVSDDTKGQKPVYDDDADEDQVFNVHVKHAMHSISDSRTVTETVHYQAADGSQVPNDHLVKANFNRTGTHDEVTGADHWNAWNISSYDFDAVPTPVKTGYTPDVQTVPAETVTPSSNDIRKVVTYAPDAQKLNVKFIDDTTGQVLKTVAKTGVTNAAAGYNTQSDIQSYEGQHYVLVSDSSHGANLVFDNDDNTDQAYEVHLKHGTHPINEHHTITQTVHYIATDHASVPDDHTVSVQFDRDGYHDEVTGVDHWNAWKQGGTQTFTEVSTPKKAGYTPDKSSVPATVVHPSDHNQAITVTYTPDTQKVIVTFIDDTDNGKTLKTVTKTGPTNSNVGYTTGDDINTYKGQHYVLVSDQTHGQSITFDTDTNTDQRYEVHLKHATHQINDHRTITETVHYKMTDGTTAPADHTVKIEFSRDGFNDEVTGADHWNAWTPAATHQFDAVHSPEVKGYTPDADQIAAVTVNPDSQNIERTVTYSPDAQKLDVTFIDDTAGITLKTVVKNGVTRADAKYNTKSDIQNFESQHYVLVSDSSNGAELVFDDDDAVDQHYTVHLKHATHAIKEHHTVNETIHYTAADDSKVPVDHIADVQFDRDGFNDEVTGTDHWNAWTPSATQKFAEVPTPAKTGYTPDLQAVSAKTVGPTDGDINVTVTYAPDVQKLDVKFIDDSDNGKVLKTVAKSGATNADAGYNTQSDIDSYKSQHYVLVSDSSNGQALKFDDQTGTDQHYVVHLKHATHAIKEHHTVSETVHYAAADGSNVPADHTADVQFDRDGFNDEVNGTDHWNAWTPSATQKFAEVPTPAKTGYTPDLQAVSAKTVGPTDGDINVTVTYAPDVQKLDVKFIDDSDNGKVLKTVAKSGATNTDAGYNTESDIQNFEGQHYILVIDSSKGQALKFDDQTGTDQHYEVHLKHAIHAINEHHTVNETIHYAAADGSKVSDDHTASVQFDRDGFNDEVTGTDHWNAWKQGNTQTFAEVPTPVKKGYTPDVQSVDAVTVNPTDQDVKRTVTYTPDAQKLDVTFIDDTAGTTLKTVAKTGVTNADAKYSTQSDIQSYEGQHYVLVSDSSNGAELVFDDDDSVDQHYVVHLKHNTHAISEHHTVNETVHYKMSDGTKAPADYHAKALSFSRDGFNDEVTGIDHWNAWTPNAEQTFDKVASPLVAGYTPDSDQINAQTVKPTDTDLEFTVTYSPNVQLAHVKYIDDTDHKVLTQDDLNGRTGETSGYHTADRITEFKRQHYVFVSDNYPAEGMTFDNHDRIDQTYEVHFKHATRTDEQDVQVPRTIKYVYQDGRPAQPDHTDALKFHETKVVDLVDGHTVSDDWTFAQDFKTIETPAIQGYTPDHSSISNTGIAHDHSAIVETVTYNPDAQKVVVKYIDDTTGEQLEAKDLTGVSDQSTGYSTKDTIDGYINQHYVLVRDDTDGKTVVFDHDDQQNQSYEVHLKHGTEPANESRTKKITVHYQYADGSARSGKAADDQTVASLTFKRTGTHDLVTDKTAWNAWDHSAQTFAEIDSSAIEGYTPDQAKISDVSVTADSPEMTEKTVVYHADAQKLSVKFIDDPTGKTLKTVAKIGHSDESAGYSTKSDLQSYLAKHYDLVSDQTNGESLVFDHDDKADQHYEVHLTHHLTPINEQHTITETIHYQYADGLARSGKAADDYHADALKFSRTGNHDNVTDSDHWNAWTPADQQTFDRVQSPAIEGYTPDQAQIDAVTMTPDSQSIEKTVTYTADAQKLTVNFIDDTTGKTLKTISKDGHSDEAVGYNTKSDLQSYLVQHYDLVSDDTKGQDLIFDHDDSQNQVYNVHLSHHTHKIDEQHTVAETIHYVYADGLARSGKAADDFTVHALKFSRDGFNDEVTGIDHWNAWTPSDHQTFAAVQSPAIEGYTPDQAQIDAVTVDPDSQSIEKTVVYTADAQKLSVNFIDDTTGKTLKTVTKTGRSDEAAGYSTKSDIQNFVGQHYDLVSDATNGADLVFDHNDGADQAYDVHLSHHTHKINEQHTVAETVHYQYADGLARTGKAADDFTAAPLSFSRDGFNDEVTGVDHWNAWTPADHQTFAAVQSPVIEGYTPDQAQIDAVTIDPDSQNIEKTVTYSADGQKLTVNFIDDTTGKTLKTVDKDGHSDESAGYSTKSDLQSYLAKHYDLVSDDTHGQDLVFDHDDSQNQVYNVHLIHHTHPINEHHTVTETVHYQYADGLARSGKAADDFNATLLSFSRDGFNDEVTGIDHWNAWTPADHQMFAAVQSPAIEGYTPDQSEIGIINVVPTSQSIEKTVTYSADQQKLTVNFIDDTTGETLKTVAKTGRSDEAAGYSTKSDLQSYLAKHYDLVSDATKGADLVFDHNDAVDQAYDVHLTHHLTPISDHQVVNETIHYVYADGLARTGKAADDYVAAPLEFSRTGKHDDVTGTDAWDAWIPGNSNFAAVQSPLIQGYTPDQSQIDVIPVDANSQDVVKTVTYSADQQTVTVDFIDDTDNGKVLKTVTKTGGSDEAVGYNTKADIQIFVDGHYKLDHDTSNGENLVFDHDDAVDQHYEVHLTHATAPISEATSTNQVIHYQLADGTPVAKDYTAKVDFSRDGFKDLVTNADHWNAWTPNATQTFDAVASPVKAGYTVDHARVDAVTVEPHHADLETTVTYSPDAQKSTVKYVDDTTGKTLQTKELTGVSDETSAYTTESTINQYVGQHYKLVSDQTNGKPVVFDHDDGSDQVFEVHLAHTYQNVSQEHQVHQTIHYQFADGKEARPDYTAAVLAFSRTGTQDLVTENIQWNAWTPDQVFAAVNTPAVNGYTPDVQTVALVKVGHNSKDIEQTVVYHADDQTILVNYIDDDTHSTLKTDSIIGKTAQTSDYTTKKSLDQYKGQHYDVVSDDTNGNTLKFDSDSTKVQTYNVHLKHQHQAASDKSTVHQTVHYVYQDGKQAAKDHTAAPIEFTRTGDTDLVTGKTTWNAWTPATGTFVAVLSPAIAGYTPSRAMINHVDVHPGDKDLDTTVTYVPDQQVIVVNYIDQTTGKTLKTDTLNGRSDQTSSYATKSQINSYLGQHYKLISDDTNGQTLTFDHDDQATQTYDVVLGHQTEAAHRTHEVRETVDYAYADGSQAAKSFAAQPLVFSQTGVHDLVTNTTDWNGEWTKPQVFAAVESPKIIGFTANKPEVKAVEVNHQSSDVHELVIYAANAQTAQIKYIDDVTGKTLETDGANGHFGESIVFGHNVNDQINKFKQAHYKLVSNNFAGQKYQADNTKNVYEVHLIHERQNVHATDSVTETVKFQYADGLQAQPTKTQTVNFGRDGIKDLVTGTTAWMPVDPQTIGAVNVPAIDGYTADTDQVPAVKVNFDDNDIEKVVTYTANDQTAGIKIIDDATGKVLNTQSATGKFGTEIQFKQNPDQQVIDLQAQHYELVSDNFNHQKYQADNAKNQFEIHVKHQMMDVQRTDKVTETVRYQDNHGNMLHPVTTQTKMFTEHGITDKVTGKTVWTPSKSQTMDAVSVPEITGYTPDKHSVPAATVNFGDKDINEVIVYTPVSETANIKYIDDTTGKTLLSDQVTGDFGSQIKFDHDPLAQINQYEGQGYELVSNSYGKTVHQFSATSGENNFEVHFKHGTMPVIDTDTVTETIHYLGPDGNKLAPDNTQTITFTRHGIKDQVTGQIDWNSVEPQEFNAVKSPVINGYQADIAVVEGRQVLFGDQDVVVNVHYTKLPEQQPGKQLGTDMVNTGKVTPKKVVTVANGTVQETKQDAIKNSGQSTMQDTKQLPQTGNDNRAGLLSLIGSSLMASLAIFGLSKKKKHEN